MTKLSVSLLTRKRAFLRLDFFPFVLLYQALLLWYLYGDEELLVYQKLSFLVAVFCNCLAYLTGQWSTTMKALIQFRTISGPRGKIRPADVARASHARVVYIPKQRSERLSQIVEVQKQSAEQQELFYFKYMEKKYVYDADKCCFTRVKPRLVKQTKASFLAGSSSAGGQSLNLYEKNSIVIPLKKFSDILRSQLMEPFSFFQLFSISLWMMDENRFYAILTIGLLLLSACTVVIQRMRIMITLRQMKLNPQNIQVYRKGQWSKISSEELVPGDICIIQASHNIKPFEQAGAETDEQYLRKAIPFSDKLPNKFFMTEKIHIDSYKWLPCDFLLLTGNCIVNEAVLTGESVPQIKDSIELLQEDEIIDIKSANKNSVLYCGTEVIQIYPSEYVPDFIKQRPTFQGGQCIAQVLKTGFDTSKGKLMRTVLFNTENAVAKQKDAYFLIFVLLIFSIISSAYVLYQGLGEERDKNKLFLRCVLIITTVVPPELPMILQIAVNTSMLYLQRKKIFCTEPYRIPLAGKVGTLAFDKTGTLTSDNFVFQGIVDGLSGAPQFKRQLEASEECQCVLSGCHSIMYSQQTKRLTGDPIELLFFEVKEWDYNTLEKKASFKRGDKTNKILKTFPFKSDLKRMSTVCYWSSQSTKQYRVLAKGAPEVIQQLLVSVPDNYEPVYQQYTKQGLRVLALAYKVIEGSSNIQQMERSAAEQQLHFAGFFVCKSPLKRDTLKQISHFQAARLKLVMITGDNILTAIAIGKKLKFHASSKVLTLCVDANEQFYFQSDDDDAAAEQKAVITPNSFAKKQLQTLSEQYMLATAGDVLASLFQRAEKNSKNLLVKQKIIRLLLPCIVIFARASPEQKECIISHLQQAGHHIMMCGDGTNDAGALKKADAGIAIVGLQDQTEEEYQKLKAKRQQQKEEAKKQARSAFMQASQMQADDQDYKFGDACIAAPFTSKHSSSIKCVYILLRQGICTLVTTIQTYKMLALGSIVQAYSLSALHMQKLKFSELQYTVLGISGAFCYYQVSKSQPLKKLSPTRPAATIFEPFFLLSTLVQSGLHLYATEQSVQIGLRYSTPEDLAVSNDEEFKPTFVNTAVFLFSLLSQICISLFNNGGEPHMEGFRQKKFFFKVLMFLVAGTLVLTWDLFPELSLSMDLKFAGIPHAANEELFALFLLILLLSYVSEMALRFIQHRKFYYWI